MMEMAGAAQGLAAAQEPGRDDEYGRVLESATTAIGTAETFRSPYPHIFFRNFFPADFYRLLLERFPARGQVCPAEWRGDPMAIQPLRRTV